MYLSTKLLAICLAAMLVLTPNLYLFAEEPAARNLSVFRVEGDDAFLSRSLHGRGTAPREGQRLSLGNVMQTGLDTQVYMQLDAASIVKQDELTYVAVSSAGNLLSLSVLRGSALVDVQEMEPEHRLETRIGSTAMTVRGTLFVASIREGGATVITMLAGEGAVLVAGAYEEIPLMQGNVFWAHDLEDDIAAFAVRPLELEAMSLFELQETWNYRERLLEIGTITHAMQAQLQVLINNRQTERDNRRQAQLAAFEELLEGDLQDAVYVEIAEPTPRYYSLVWIVEPNLPHESIAHCDCGIYHNEGWMIINPQTGNLTGLVHGGHGPWMPVYVFDRERNLFGHPARERGYFDLIGLHPYAEAWQRFTDVRNTLMVVENVNSELSDYWWVEGFGGGWALWPDAYLGEFAVMYNGQLVTDFVFNYSGQRLGAGTVAVRRGGLWGLIDRQGNEATPFMFEHIVPIDDNSAFARVGGRYGILDIRASFGN